MQENKASRLFLICSVILGVLAAVVSFAYLDKATSADNGPKIKVIVAKHDLRENSPLDPEKDFDELDIPANMTALQSRGLRPEDSQAYKGQRVNRMILAGTPIMLADLVAATDLTIDGDHRALSIPAKGAAALSRLLVAGDWVKLLVTFPIAKAPQNGATTQETNPANQFQTMEILPDPVRVLAVGSRLSRSRQQISVSDQYATPAETESQQTVTLEVTEAQAAIILSQTGAGQLPVWIILCPPQSGTK